MSEIPKPISPRPWTQPRDLGPVFDANGGVVSFIENCPFLFHVEQCHDELIAALKLAKRLILKHGGTRRDLRRINDALLKARGKL
jgi:hypothetical protein